MENKIYDEIKIGDHAKTTRLIRANDLILFAHASGNINPMHLPQDIQRLPQRQEPVAPSMLGGSLFSQLLGTQLPGPGTLYRSQSLTFHGRAHVGDELEIQITVKEKRDPNLVMLDCHLRNNDTGELIADGEAEVFAPLEKQTVSDASLPDYFVAKHESFNRLLSACKAIPAIPTAVIAADDASSLGGAWCAYEEGLISPIFIGDQSKLEEKATELGYDLSHCEIINIPNHREAAAKGVELVHQGKAQALMKGNLHSDELLGQVTKKEGGLRTHRRISHSFVLDVPGRSDLLHVTDAAINIAPSLEAKVDIVQNAIDLALALGNEEPRVGILSAVEVVNPKIPSTLDAAILSKMADRGQIKGGIVDGPLAMDNAISAEAAKTKGITSLVAGHAEILVAPNLESGNMLAKELTFVAHAEAAGLVLGAKVPVILTSRADNEMARLASAALALLYQYWKENGVSLIAPDDQSSETV